MSDTHENKVAAMKAGAAWGGTGVSYYLEQIGFRDWGDVAAFLAAIYSVMLIGEWIYKKWKARK